MKENTSKVFHTTPMFQLLLITDFVLEILGLNIQMRRGYEELEGGALVFAPSFISLWQQRTKEILHIDLEPKVFLEKNLTTAKK